MSTSYTLLAQAFGSSEWMDTFLSTVVYALLGLVLFGVTFFVITRVTPFSMRKEIEDDQNTALAIMVGSVMLGLAIILAASISG